MPRAQDQQVCLITHGREEGAIGGKDHRPSRCLWQYGATSWKFGGNILVAQHQSNFQAVRMKRAELDLELEAQDWEHVDEFSAVLSSVGDNERELIDTPDAG